MTIAIPWHTLKEREKLVWATVYALNADGPEEGVRKANQAIQALQARSTDGIALIEPEYDAACSGVEIKWEQFLVWYPIARAIKHRERISNFDADENACRIAFESYRMSKNDYF